MYITFHDFRKFLDNFKNGFAPIQIGDGSIFYSYIYLIVLGFLF
jgi:hypothetical protein